MAVFPVLPGAGTIQAELLDLPDGSILELDDGVYTTGATILIITNSSTTNTVFTDLTIRAKNPGMAILDFSTCTNNGIYGGDASGVTIKDVVFSGNSTQPIHRDAVNNSYAGWTWDNITIRNMTKTPWQFGPGGSAIGTQVAIKNVVTEATFGGDYVVWIQGPATNLDMNIDGIDARLNDGTIINGIYLQDCRDVRIRNVKINNPTTAGIKLYSVDIAKTCRDIYVSDVTVDTPGVYGIHVGNEDWVAGNNTTRIKLHNIIVENSGHDGVSFDNFVTDSELVGFYIRASADYGIELEEECERILVCGGHIVGGPTGAPDYDGINMALGSRHQIINNVITDVRFAIKPRYRTSPGLPNGPDPIGSEYTIQPERYLVRDNVFFNCDYIYAFEATGGPTNVGAMPSGVLAHMIGPNTVYTPRVSYARSDGSPMTKEAFEAAFPTSVDTPDNVVSSSVFTGVGRTPTQSLNAIAGTVGLTPTQALNYILNTSGSTPTQALNVMALRGDAT